MTAETHSQLALCFYRVWSAYSHWGHVDGAKMIKVHRLSDIAKEFNLQMELEKREGQSFFGIESPSRWHLRFAMLRDGSILSTESVTLPDSAEELLV